MFRLNKQYVIGGIVFVLFLGALMFYRYFDYFYYSLALAKISNEVVEGVEEEDQYHVLFEYTSRQVKKDMFPGYDHETYHLLEYGYSFCDQKATILMNLLYYQGLESRVVPIFYADGSSDHTVMEWKKDGEWLLIDPHWDKELNIPVDDLLNLSKEEVVSQYGISEEDYDFYKDTYFGELIYTYSEENEDFWYWGPVEESKSKFYQIVDRVSLGILKISDKAIPNMMQSIYLFKHYRGGSLFDKYMVARNYELFGNEDEALKRYEDLLSDDNIEQDWPDWDDFSVNKEMIEQRVEILKEGE